METRFVLLHFALAKSRRLIDGAERQTTARNFSDWICFVRTDHTITRKSDPDKQKPGSRTQTMSERMRKILESNSDDPGATKDGRDHSPAFPASLNCRLNTPESNGCSG